MTAEVVEMPVAEYMLPRDLQETNEKRFSRKHINNQIRLGITCSETLMDKVREGAQLLEAWLDADHYESKAKRLKSLKTLDLKELVLDVFVDTAYVREPTLLTSVTGQLAGKLHFNEKATAIQTLGEILAVLARTGVYTITKQSTQASLMLCSCINVSDRVLAGIRNACYLPPMVCEPETIRHNRESGYLTHNDSVILRGYNHHDGDVCLDVINTQNQTALSLNLDFLRQVDEEPTKDFTEVDPNLNEFEQRLQRDEQKKQWENFKAQSTRMYVLMATQGNRFWITNKVDKRGRIYSQGYHINPQGTSYKKAMLELADKETVDGVPHR
jgi:hypothetical protein